LSGVRGATSPQEAAELIEPDGFLPVDINVRAGSIDRLVKLLGGEALYGADPMIPIRELLQNSSDAIRLRLAVAETALESKVGELPIEIRFALSPTAASLTVADFGVGMSRDVMERHLVSIASDYWGSRAVHVDFPRAV